MSCDFQTFRNELHHELKEKGDLETVVNILEDRRIDYYLAQNQYLFSLYLLSLIDYILKRDGYAVPSEYHELRLKKLSEPYYVGDHLFWKEYNDCIPEFVQHNIYEGDLYDAV